jgi:putative oxidoreductase
MNKFFSATPIAQHLGIAIVRIITGAFLIYHGWEVFDRTAMIKYLEWDQFHDSSGETMVYAGKVAELVAGVLLVLGLFTRIASILVIGTLGYIAFFIGDGKVWAGAQHPFFFVLLGFLFLFTGPGALSLDSLLFNKRR